MSSWLIPCSFATHNHHTRLSAAPAKLSPKFYISSLNQPRSTFQRLLPSVALQAVTAPQNHKDQTMAEKLIMYGLPVSPYFQRVAMVLHECGVDEWETVPVSPLTGDTKKPEYLALNPTGKIPVLKDGDLTLFESRTIARYLLEKYPETGAELLGRDIKERAEVGKWVDVEAVNYNQTIAGIMRNTIFARIGAAKVNEAQLKDSVEKFSALLDAYEKHLAEHEFLALGRLTFADLTHLPQTAMLEFAGYGHLISSRPHVAKWWSTISSRPSWVKIMDGPTIPKFIVSKEEEATKVAA